MSPILLVDDEPVLLESLKDFLAYEGFSLVTARTLAEARERVGECRLIVLDWMLPDGQGIELLREWRGRGVRTPVILLTARSELVDKVLGLELGADDYLTKPFEPRELLARIRARLRERHAERIESPLSRAGITLCPRRRQATWRGAAVILKKMEFDLLKVFLENPDQVFSRDELLNTVWGYDHYPTTRTVDTHVLALRQKFDADLFETVRGIGYRFREKRIDG